MARSFCEECFQTLSFDRCTLRDLWEEVGDPGLKAKDARRALELLYRVSHGRILSLMGESVARHYPTVKRYPGRLLGDGPLWWVFHATGGVSIKPVLTWFSSKARRAPGLADGHVSRPRGGSAHFVVDLDGSPWGLIPVEDGAWHCRGRNFDSLSLELVNACSLTRPTSEEEPWRWWAGEYRLPYEPVETAPWRGGRWWQPYQASQLVTAARLVRLCAEALGRDRFCPERTSQHSQWAKRKLDCGPLFPQEALVEAALSEAPLQDHEWFSVLSQDQDRELEQWPGWLAGSPSEPPAEEAVDRQELAELLGHSVLLDAEGAPRDVEESWSATDPAALLRRVQEALQALGFYGGQIDGIYGPVTRRAVILFQERMNRSTPEDLLAVDGIPGPLTRNLLLSPEALGKIG